MEVFNIEKTIIKLQEIKKKGVSIEMKNKDRFQNYLTELINLLREHATFFESQKNDYSCCKYMSELNDTIEDMEDKLKNLGLIKYCRDRAEKIFAAVTEKLHNNYLLLLSLFSKNSAPQNDDKKEVLEHITKLSLKINLLEEELKKRDQKPVEEVKETYNKGEKSCFEGLKYYLGLQGRVNYKKAYDWFKQSQEENCSFGMIMLAKMYEKGDYVEKSSHKAFELYKLAAEDNSTALFMVGHYAENKIYEDIKEYGDTNEMALKFYTEAAEKKNSDAFVKLGKVFENGNLSQNINFDLAVKNYKTAIDLDENPEAYNCLGSLYYRGKPLKQNHSVAFEYFLKSANMGNADAMNNTGICYEYGKGVMNNFDKALNYYQMAADRLHPRGLSNKAILLLKNNISMDKKIFKEAIRLLKLSIHLEPKNKDANYHLGNIYENALGIPQNAYLALKYYKKAMKLGHVKSQTKVALALYNGYPGVYEKNELKALELLEDSANKEEPDAMNYLALLLEKGTRSVRQDKEKSLELFKKAHDKGHDFASLNLALSMKNTGNSQMEGVNRYKEFVHISAKRGNEYAKMIDEHLIVKDKNIAKSVNSFK